MRGGGRQLCMGQPHLILLFDKKNVLTKNKYLDVNAIKFMFSKKATKFDEIFTINLTLTTY